MTIGELSIQTVLPVSTIRYWERIGILPDPRRSSGQRRYAAGDVQRLSVLRLARLCGFSLQQMGQLLQGCPASTSPAHRWQELARRKQKQLAAQIAQRRAMRKLVARVQQCRCVDLAGCARIAASVLGPAQ